MSPWKRALNEFAATHRRFVVVDPEQASSIRARVRSLGDACCDGHCTLAEFERAVRDETARMEAAVRKAEPEPVTYRSYQPRGMYAAAIQKFIQSNEHRDWVMGRLAAFNRAQQEKADAEARQAETASRKTVQKPSPLSVVARQRGGRCRRAPRSTRRATSSSQSDGDQPPPDGDGDGGSARPRCERRAR